jgi:hypothetical protein
MLFELFSFSEIDIKGSVSYSVHAVIFATNFICNSVV